MVIPKLCKPSDTGRADATTTAPPPFNFRAIYMQTSITWLEDEIEISNNSPAAELVAGASF